MVHDRRVDRRDRHREGGRRDDQHDDRRDCHREGGRRDDVIGDQRNGQTRTPNQRG